MPSSHFDWSEGFLKYFFNKDCFFLLEIFLKHHSLLEFFRSHWLLHLHLLFWLYLNVGVSRLSSPITYPLFNFMHWWFCLLIEPYNFKHHGYVNYTGFTPELQTHTYNYILNMSIWVLMSISCLILAKLNAYFPPCLLVDMSLFQWLKTSILSFAQFLDTSIIILILIIHLIHLHFHPPDLNSELTGLIQWPPNLFPCFLSYPLYSYFPKSNQSDSFKREIKSLLSPPTFQSFAMSLKAENKVLTLTFKALHELTTLPSGFIPYFSHPPSWTLLQPHSSIIAIQKYQPHSQLGAFAPWTLTVFSPDTHVAISHYYWSVIFSMRHSPSPQSKMQFPPLHSLSFPCHSPWHFPQSDMQYGILFLILNACFLLL